MSIETTFRWAIFLGGIFGLSWEIFGLAVGLARPWDEAREEVRSVHGKLVFQVTERRTRLDFPVPGERVAYAEFLILSPFDIVQAIQSEDGSFELYSDRYTRSNFFFWFALAFVCVVVGWYMNRRDLARFRRMLFPPKCG